MKHILTAILLAVFISGTVTVCPLPGFQAIAAEDTDTAGDKNPPPAELIEHTSAPDKPITDKSSLVGLEGKPETIRILKESDIDRIGADAAYEEFAGLRFAKYFTVGQEVHIYQEAKPIDSYILDAWDMRVVAQTNAAYDKGEAHKRPVEFRSQIVPQFTRNYRTQFTISDPDDLEGQVRYTLDYRDIYKQYYPVFPNLQVERWLQHEVMFIHAKQVPGCEWYYTANIGYRFANIVVKEEALTQPPWQHTYHASDEQRHYFLSNIALAPTDRFEWFGQFEYFMSRHPRISNQLGLRANAGWPFLGTAWESKPDHFYYNTEFRFKSVDKKTVVIPRFSYSIDRYFPFRDIFEKYEMAVDVGHDFTKKLKAKTRIQYVIALNNATDNNIPTWNGNAPVGQERMPNPHKTCATWVGTENRVSYNFWDKWYAKSGVDFAAGTNMSDFDNWATMLGMEYYNPGLLRASVEWHTNYYYNINDHLNTLQFRFWIFI